MNLMTNGNGTESMEARLAKVGSRIDSLMSKVRDMGADTDQHVRDVMGDLYTSVERELRRIERRIQSTSNAVDEDVAKTRADLLESFREELAVWRGRIEGFRLQATLGKMEVGEQIQPAIDRMEVLYSSARRYLHDMSRDELSWDELQPQLMGAMKDLRREFDAAGDQFLFA